MLVMWEAQFGDFANGAQVIIDQFLASAELKWDRWSGITLLLPHGYEGAGPEHSSARMERFLQLCGNDNMQVVYPSTAAQTFHMFRRQVRAPFRKPLIVMTPKSLLRVPTSRIEEVMEGRFQEILDDPRYAAEKQDRERVRRVLLCTGKIYHELAARREEAGAAGADVAIVRVEQVYPFHAARMREVLASYPKAQQVAWVQEEPRNMGAWQFISEALREQCGLKDLRFIGRARSASPAVGSKSRHKIEQEAILSAAIAPASAGEHAAASHKAGKNGNGTSKGEKKEPAGAARPQRKARASA
jgi:2-oxoglutarate dehydrogenase E1 component